MGRHLEQAAVEQLSETLRGQGYQVESQAPLGDAKADLIARKGDTVLVYEVKVAGQKTKEWASLAANLRKQAAQRGYQFRCFWSIPRGSR